jgi:hypothetical protein
MKNKTNKAPTLRCEAMVSLLPCPLCESSPRDLGYGVSCPTCGLWLGDGSQAQERGGYIKTWNTRKATEVRIWLDDRDLETGGIPILGIDSNMPRKEQ